MKLSSLLKNKGPCLSSTLAELLIQSKNISAESARKVISRAVLAGEISSIKNLFPKREQFVYLSDTYGSDEFWHALTEALIKSGSALGLALSALLARGGIIPRRDFGAASGSPVAMKKKISFSVVWQRLVNIGLCTEIFLPGIGECIALREKEEKRYDSVSRQIHARLVTESIFIATLVQWSQNLNMISYNLARTRQDEEGKAPAVSNYLFDFTGPSYLSPLLTQGNSANKPGFFACDVLLGTRLTLPQVQPFIAKCKSLRSMKNIGKILFMLAASQFEEDAFKALKKEGIIPATPENLFGEDFAESLRELTRFLSYYFTDDSANLEKIDSIMVALTHVQGAAAQLQGALFEYLVAEVVKHEGTVEVGKLVRSADGKKAFWVTGQNDRQPSTAVFNHFHQPFEPRQCITVQVMRLINKQCHRTFTFFDQLLQFPLATFTLFGDLHLLILRQVVKQGVNQRGEPDTLFVHRQGAGDNYFVFIHQLLLQASQGDRFATSDHATDGYQSSFAYRPFNVFHQLLMVSSFIIPCLFNRLRQSIMLHHFNPHGLLLIVCYENSL